MRVDRLALLTTTLMLPSKPKLQCRCCGPSLLFEEDAPPEEPQDTTDYYALRFDGVRRLYGKAAPSNLRSARVVVVGLGGVGSWAVEALARSGVGTLVLIDPDEICISNTNRQLHALKSTVGRSKARELAARIIEINPECAVHVREEWVTEANAHGMLQHEAAEAHSAGGTLAVLDAIDEHREKAAMVRAAHALGVHLVCVGATGGKADPTAIRVADLYNVTDDLLLKNVRRHLRKAYGYPEGVAGSPRRRRGKQRFGVQCVHSLEPVRTIASGLGTQCDRFGTACFGTGAFGFAAAAAITEVLARGEPTPERPPLPPLPPLAPPPEAGASILDLLNESEDEADAADAADAEDAEDGEGVGEGGGMGAEPTVTSEAQAAQTQPGESASSSSHLPADAGGEAAATPTIREGPSTSASSWAIFDSHTHAIGEARALLAGPAPAGVCLMSVGEAEWPAMLQAAADAAALQPTAAAAEVTGTTRVAMGVHPWYVDAQTDGWPERLRASLLREPGAVVGEAGLDRARLDSSWDAQLVAFRTQLRLAAELRRALVVHCVRADGALLDLLRAEAAAASSLPPVLVMHAFGGSVETAATLARLSASASRTCRIFFGFSARAVRLRRAAAVIASVPADALLLESDEHTADGAAAALAEACARVAHARGWSEADAAARTAANARQAFNVDAWAL